MSFWQHLIFKYTIISIDDNKIYKKKEHCRKAMPYDLLTGIFRNYLTTVTGMTCEPAGV